MRAQHLIGALMGTLLSSATLPAEAQDTSSGNYWLQKCSERVPEMCVGYLEGALATHIFLVKPPLFCPPTGVTVGQMLAIVIKSLKDHPQALHLPFALLIPSTLRETFPCPKTSN